MQVELGNDEYKIGAVAKVTGIGTETLRAWERRYQAVVPKRSESGDRIYTRDQLSRLLLLKSLVDTGNAIGTIAHLSVSELKRKWDNQMPVRLHESSSQLTTKTGLNLAPTCRVVLFGDEFPLRVLDGMSDFKDIEVVAHVSSLHQWKQDYQGATAQVVIIERPTINSETQELAKQLLQETSVWHVIVLYGFGSQQDINNLQSSQISAIRSSIDVYELARLCVDRAGGNAKTISASNSATVFDEESIPARRYSNKQLDDLSRCASVLQCECPQHLSDLIKSLVAFEIYSAECENRNKDDAELHAFLHATTAQARAVIEDALAHVIAYENITV